MAGSKASQSPIDLILETSSVLFLCGTAFAVFSFITRGTASLIPLVIAASLPAAASLLLVIAGIMFPAIYAVRRLAFPLNITLPLMHCSMVFMLAELTRGSFGLERLPELLVPALAWGDVRFLALACLGQVIVLSLMVGLKGSTLPPEPSPDVQR